ncbi:DoxX family protein [Mycobacterium sp.]|uniref:DoxX family protein n=1 Tax=Mycobacterium sp. TaxID=1785 RepID=UPI0028B87E4A|nr:hypothetical protein [Mycobacterium sp.]MDT5052894.1 hypothetical protein [Mycobacterium sp.]
MSIAIIVLSALLAVAFLGSGGLKLAGAKQSLQMRDQLHVGAQLWRVVGALEAAGAVGLVAGFVVPALGIAAAVGLALLMVGGIVAHARAQDLRNAGPAALLLVLAVATAVLRIASI